MRLYSFNKRAFFLVFLGFFSCFGVSLLVGIAGPPIIETNTVNGSSPYVLSNHDLKTGPFVLKSPPMSVFHQQLWLVAHLHTDNRIGTTYEQDVHMSVLIRGVDDGSQVSGDTGSSQLHQDAHNLTRKLRCVTVEFYDLSDVSFNIRSIFFDFKSFNTSFTKIELWIRFVFLVMTFFTTTDRRFSRFYLPKLLLVGLLWIMGMLLALWQWYNELHNPTYFYRLDTANFMDFKVLFLAWGALYIICLVYLMIRAYSELRQMPYFDMRLKFVTVSMVTVFSITTIVVVLRFGGDILQENFVAELSTNYQNSAEFVSIYGLINFYMFTMAFVYSPSPSAFYESHFTDNPALSMLNDSDEEIHYESEHDETTLTNLSRQANDFSR